MYCMHHRENSVMKEAMGARANAASTVPMLSGRRYSMSSSSTWAFIAFNASPSL